MLWLEILMLIFKYGPMIIELVIAIWNLIKKQPVALQAGYKAELRAACKLMNSNKLAGNNALLDLKEKLEAAK